MRFDRWLRILAMWPAVATGGAAEYQAQLPDAPGKAVFEKTCATCHEIKDVIARRRTKTSWQQVVEDMVARGAEGSQEDLATVVAYLSGQFGRVNVNVAGVDEIQKSLGFSEKDARAIVAYREKNGKIQDFEELQKVPGIDAEKLREKRASIAFAQ